MKDQREIDAIRLDAFLPYQITVLADAIARRTATIAETRAGLNLSQWRVIAAIAERPGRTANEVAAVTPMDKGVVSRAVKALLATGLVVRKASQADGRLGHLHLTAKGQDIYARLAGEIREIETALLAGFSHEDQQRLRDCLARLCDEIR